MDWLHWVGASYTIPSFIREAKDWGVSRRIKPATIKQMAWGDRIYLASREKGLKAPVVFGLFYLDTIKGIRLNEDARARMEAETGKHIEVVSHDPALLVRRGCGFCQEGGLYLSTDSEVKDLLDYGEPEDPEVRGKLYVFPRPWVALKNLRPFRGYRPFDGEAFRRDISLGKSSGRRMLEDLYYC